MKERYPLANPMTYKTYNPNWEPWASEEEYLPWISKDCNHDDDAC